MTHKFFNHLGAEGNFATALLTASQHSNTDFMPNAFANRFLSSTIVVPELEAKLGLNYVSFLHNSYVEGQIGWMWLHYFKGSVYDNYNLSSDALLGPSSNGFSVQGLYFGLQ